MNRSASRCAAPLAATLLLSAFACGDSSTQPPATATGRDQGNITLTTQTAVLAVNPIGPLIVNGENVGPLMRWVLDKSVTAPTPDAARAALTFIRLLDMAIPPDTLGVLVDAPLDTEGRFYSAQLTLGIPARKGCLLWVAGEARVSYLQSDLEIWSGGPVTVNEHTGSCRIDTISGDISIHLWLPTGGECIATADEGRIALQVQSLASARVSLLTGAGNVTVINLSLTNVVQSSGSLTGILGAGAGEIRLATGGGDVVLIGY